MIRRHKCARCHKVKAITAYYPGLISWCRLCRKAYRKARYAALTPEQKNDQIWKAKLNRYYRGNGSTGA